MVDQLARILILLGSAFVMWYGTTLAKVPGTPGVSEKEPRTKEQRRLGWLLIGAGLLVAVWIMGPLELGEVTR